MFEVHEADRKNYAYEVRYGSGRSYCRCSSYRDAVKIASSLNLANHPEETLAKLKAEFGYEHRP
jgi:hypothetical protein